MKTYSLFLPIFKQGDDFANCLDYSRNNIVKAFTMLAEQYKSAAEICETVADRISLIKNVSNISASGDTHSILISLPAKIAEPLIESGILDTNECD